MLKYVSKFVLEIMPSIIATVVGAYIVNHYITSRPSGAPVAAAISTVDPKKADTAAKTPDGSVNVADIPASGIRARGISEKALEKTPVEKVIEKPAEKSAEKPAEHGNAPAEAKRRQPASHEKTAARSTPVAAPAETASDHGDANDLARAVIERLRRSNEAQAKPSDKPSDVPRAPEAPRVPVQEAAAPRVLPPSIQPLPPAIMVSTPRTEMSGSDSRSPEIRAVDPRRLIPPADIPEASGPLDIEASAAMPEMHRHTTVADDMLSAAKSVFQAVLPK